LNHHHVFQQHTAHQNAAGDLWCRAVLDDAVDRVTRSTDSFGQMRDYLYDNNGNPVGENLRSGNQLLDSTIHAYDLADRRSSTTNAGGFRSLFEYDGVGNIIRVQNPDNYSVRFDYDAGNKVIKAYDEAGNAVTRTLDVDGKPRTVTDPNGNTTTYTYHDSTQDGRLKSVTSPKIQTFTSGRQSKVKYDANGNVIQTFEGTDANGAPIPDGGAAPRSTYTEYDELNRAIRVVGPAYTDAAFGLISPVVKYSYNALGQLTQISAGRTTAGCVGACADTVAPQFTYTYDDFGRKLTEADGLGRTWSFQYDIHGNVTRATDPKGNITDMTWAYGHRMLTRTSAAGNVAYTHNTLGQVVTATTYAAGNSSVLVKYTYTYDAANRLRSVTDSRGNKTLTYTYSAGGKLNQLADSEGRTTNYLYDNIGRLSGIQAPGSDTADMNYIFRYDPAGRRSERVAANGLVTRYAYNADNSLNQLTNLFANGNLISQHDYNYDAYGNRINHTENINATVRNYAYGYDELNRLISVIGGANGNESHSYDPLNNLKSRTLGANLSYAYTYDAANQLSYVGRIQTSPGGSSYVLDKGFVYDAAGNLTQKCENGSIAFTDNPPTACSGAIVSNYAYDPLNRMTAASGSYAPNHAFTYDDQGRRLSKTVGATTTNYLYNGQDILAEYQGNWSAALAHLTHGPGTDEPLQRVQGTVGQATGMSFMQDGLGSVVAAVPHSEVNGGANLATQRFDAWGQPSTQSAAAVPLYGYTGREPDATGLIYYRARYYDPSIQRFTQRDPIGVAGGVNAYAYVNNSPANFTDPTGLECASAGGMLTCTMAGSGSTFTVPSPAGFPARIAPGDTNHHAYDIQVQTQLASTPALIQGVINSPTPGPSYLIRPATPQGTNNEATPPLAYHLFLGGAGMAAGAPLNPVKSYATNDQWGNTLVVNVTQPGHALFPGVVVRQVQRTDTGTIIRNEGEGTGALQAPGSPFADTINGVWRSQSQQIINNVGTMGGALRGMSDDSGNQSMGSASGNQSMRNVSPQF
jgi:RHS repeat-associated protein